LGPSAARAPPGERVRRLGVLMHLPESDREGRTDSARSFERRRSGRWWLRSHPRAAARQRDRLHAV
jgi:hypothetical protein